MAIQFAPGASPDDAARNLAAMRARLGNLQPVLTVQAENIRTLIDDAFRSSRAPDGTAWLPLSPATIAKRRRGSSKPLLDTNHLSESITATAGRNDITIGTNVPYAGAQQFGSVRTGSLKNDSYSARTVAGRTKSGAASKNANKRTRNIGPTYKRPAGSAFQVVTPARPFLPFRIDGTLITIGPAGKVFERLARAVGEYVVTGKIT